MPLMKGAIPTPRWKLATARPYHAPPFLLSAIPTTFGCVPQTLQMWGNDQFGDCVSAEEAAAKAMYSVWYGQGSELLIPDAVLVAWARKYGFLQGATLTDPMDMMIKYGIVVDGVTYKDGPYSSVNWMDDTSLTPAIFQGPVKIGVAASQLENVHQDTNGWFASNFRKDGNTDHCVLLNGFGMVGDLADLIKVKVPASVKASARGRFLYTWSSFGIIDDSSMEAITSEAWLRSPTTAGFTPPQPTPPIPPVPPIPPPGPSPGLAPFTITMPGYGSISVDPENHIVGLDGFTSVPIHP